MAVNPDQAVTTNVEVWAGGVTVAVTTDQTETTKVVVLVAVTVTGLVAEDVTVSVVSDVVVVVVGSVLVVVDVIVSVTVVPTGFTGADALSEGVAFAVTVRRAVMVSVVVSVVSGFPETVSTS